MKSVGKMNERGLPYLVIFSSLLLFILISSAAWAGPKSDLVVSYLTRSHASVVVNQPFTIKCYVKNQGNAPSPPSVLGIRTGGSSRYHRFNVESLRPGQQSSLFEITGFSFPSPGTYTITAVADLDKTVRESNEFNNTRQMTITVTNPPKPDLAIYSITPYTRYPEVGKYDHVTVCVENKIGGAMAPATKLLFKIGGESNPRVFSIPALAPGQKYSVSRGVKMDRPIGIVITAKVDPDNKIKELREDNNEKKYHLTFVKKNLPDLTILSIKAPHTHRHLSQLFNIHVTVRNNGRAPSGNYYLRLDRPCDVPPLVACGVAPSKKVYLGSLAPGRTSTYTFSFRYRWRLGDKVLKITVDPDNKIKESNEHNNIKTFVIHVK